jgi:hypothetical protein
MPTRFFVLCRPRSRSAWLANFLTYGRESFCLHEGLLGCRSLTELGQRLDGFGTPVAGCTDTALMLLAPQLLDEFPAARFVVLVGDDAPYQRFAADIGQPEDAVQATLDAFEASCSVMRGRAMFVDYADLDDPDTVAAIWGYVGIGSPFPRQRFEMLRDMRVVVWLDALHKRVAAAGPSIEALLSGSGGS